MLSHKLEIYKGSQSEKGHQKKVDFEIEVNGDFVTVSRKRLDHSNMLQSKSFKVEQDVLVIIQNSRNNLYSVELDWLWLKPTRFDNLTLKQAEELKQLVEQLAQSKRELESQNLNLKGIKVGSQVWSESNIDIDVGLDCSFPVLEGRVLKKIGRLYTYEGAKNASEQYSNWRIPTEEDFRQLFSFFPENAWKEVTERMNFHFSGFGSKRLAQEKIDKFLEQNPALKIPNSGFYWTNEITSFNDDTGLPKSIKYLMLNKFSSRSIFKEAQCSNQNMFSLRLIRKN